MKGVVIRSTGKFSTVRDENGTLHECRLKGRFRTAGLRTTNPVAVGDHVQIEDDPMGPMISKILERKNYIVRKSVNLSHEAHVIASNIDRVILLITLKSPQTTPGFVDRLLVTAEAYSIPAILVFNKIDLYDSDDLEQLNEWERIYKQAGYSCHRISIEQNLGMDQVKSIMQGKVSMITGHSGAGKSSLVNRLQPGLDLRTSEISDYHQKGLHTTTFAEMHELDFGGSIIDTPGIKGFGLVDIPKEELHHYFPEFFELLPDCKFHNCLHLNEPGCAVLAALERGEISLSRYKSYYAIYLGDDEKNYR